MSKKSKKTNTFSFLFLTLSADGQAGWQEEEGFIESRRRSMERIDHQYVFIPAPRSFCHLMSQGITVMELNITGFNQEMRRNPDIDLEILFLFQVPSLKEDSLIVALLYQT